MKSFLDYLKEEKFEFFNKVQAEWGEEARSLFFFFIENLVGEVLTEGGRGEKFGSILRCVVVGVEEGIVCCC